MDVISGGMSDWTTLSVRPSTAERIRRRRDRLESNTDDALRDLLDRVDGDE